MTQHSEAEEGPLLLAGDVGGTKTDLAIFSPNQGAKVPLARRAYPSDAYPDFVSLVRDFLAQAGRAVAAASFGIAGPVVEGEARVTNLPWIVSERELRAALSLSSVLLLNDLVAIASAVPVLDASDLASIHPGHAVAGGAIGVIAPGTGLGEAFLVWDGSTYQAFPSEGGHADFGPNGALQIELLRYLEGKFGHVSYERVCSGIGLPNIYEFLKSAGVATEPAWLAEQIATAADPTPLIVNAAIGDRRCDLCVTTLDIFVAALGAEAGNLALKVLATGGIYLGGGIPPRILPKIASERFLNAFWSKGRMTDLLKRVPIHVITNPAAALVGAASAGLARLGQGSQGEG